MFDEPSYARKPLHERLDRLPAFSHDEIESEPFYLDYCEPSITVHCPLCGCYETGESWEKDDGGYERLVKRLHGRYPSCLDYARQVILWEVMRS